MENEMYAAEFAEDFKTVMKVFNEHLLDDMETKLKLFDIYMRIRKSYIPIVPKPSKNDKTKELIAETRKALEALDWENCKEAKFKDFMEYMELSDKAARNRIEKAGLKISNGLIDFHKWNFDRRMVNDEE